MPDSPVGDDYFRLVAKGKRDRVDAVKAHKRGLNIANRGDRWPMEEICPFILA